VIYNNKILSSHANRGMDLENDLNNTNSYYLDNDIAIVYKKPTPIKVSKVNYNKNHTIITEAFYEMPSTTDYNGIYKGKYIDFDAKEVKNSSSFALSNLHAHQLKHLKRVKEHGGISFLIVRFYKNNITYLIEIDEIIDYINSENRKSIPIDYFESKAHRIPDAYIPRVNYIKVIDNLYFK
jgi:recombination protein U